MAMHIKHHKFVQTSGLMYSKHCIVCKYLKDHKNGRLMQNDLFHSNYYNKGNGLPSIPEINKKYGNPFIITTLYQHLVRHMNRRYVTKRLIENGDQDLPQPYTLAKITKEELAEIRNIRAPSVEVLDTTLKIIDSDNPGAENHELLLDDIIKKGWLKLQQEEMQLTVPMLLQAIKTKAEIQNKTKDRKLDLLKTMFSGASPEKAVTSES